MKVVIKMSSGIYKIYCKANDKFYIGSSQNTDRRWNEHLNSLRKGTHYAKYMQRSFNKYGEESFEFEVIEKVEIDSLLESEQKYLDELQPKFNNSPTANGTRGYKFTDEQREYQSKVVKEYYENGGVPHNKGTKLTEEELKRHSEVRIGMKSGFKGKSHTEESKQKMSEAKKGVKMNEAHRKAQSENKSGEGNPSSKLTENDVIEIIKLLKDGVKSPTIAKQFNVSKHTIYAIQKGQTWTQVPR